MCGCSRNSPIAYPEPWRTATGSQTRHRWFCVQLPVTAYPEALALQRDLVQARIHRRIERDVVLILEHPPVFTLGRRGGLDNLNVSRAFLHRSNIAVVQAERGGDITYHGPGQLVVYPIVDLKGAGLTVVAFVSGLEAVMMGIAADWGIRAERNPLNRGVWVGAKKLGSVGITVRRGVSFHGFALNVDLPLAPFRWINPCGLQGVGVTAMAGSQVRPVSMEAVRDSAEGHLAAVFRTRLDPVGLDTLKKAAGIED